MQRGLQGRWTPMPKLQKCLQHWRTNCKTLYVLAHVSLILSGRDSDLLRLVLLLPSIIGIAATLAIGHHGSSSWQIPGDSYQALHPLTA